MKILKLIAFIIFTIVFIAATYIWITERNTSTMGPAAVGVAVILFFVLILMIVLGIVIAIVLLKSPKLYTYVFSGMVGAVFLYLGVLQLIDMNNDRMLTIEINKDREAEKLFNKAWNLLDSPAKVTALLKMITNDTEKINERKSSLYLALSLKEDNYRKSFIDAMTQNPESGCHVVEYLLENYNIETEKELLSLFQVFKKYGTIINLNSCIPREQEDNFTFDALIEKQYFVAAIASLEFQDIDIEKYIRIAQKINNETYRKQAISTIIDLQDIFYQYWNESYTVTELAPILLSLKDEKKFQAYITVLQKKLTLALSKENKNPNVWKYYNNQQTQEQFMIMYKLLGAEHPLIQLIPEHITAFYLKQEKEILKHGRDNYILYRNFLSQMEGDINHNHPYYSEPYSVYSNGKLVHEGLSNEHGYISYKAYGANADDLITIETGPTGRWEQHVGWASLLQLWNTKQGMFDRLEAIGNISYEQETLEDFIVRFQNDYKLDNSKGFTLESAQKAKELFDTYMNDKWCK